MIFEDEITPVTDVEFFAELSRRFVGMQSGQAIDIHSTKDGFEWWDTVFQVSGNRILLARQMKERPGIIPAHVKYYRFKG